MDVAVIFADVRGFTAIAEAMHRWSQARQRRGAAPVHVGIGAHCGQAFAGVLSDGRQLEYRVSGDTVNVASRLADLAPRDRTSVVVSSDLAGAAGGLAEPWRWTEIANQELPGHPRAITVLRLE